MMDAQQGMMTSQVDPNAGMALFMQAAQQAGLTPANSQQILVLAAQALKNPDSYPQFVEQANALGFSDVPQKFDEKFLQIIIVLAQKAVQ